MLKTETSHLWKVSYAIILLGWRYNRIEATYNILESAVPRFTQPYTDCFETMDISLWLDLEICNATMSYHIVLYKVYGQFGDKNFDLLSGCCSDFWIGIFYTFPYGLC